MQTTSSNNSNEIVNFHVAATFKIANSFPGSWWNPLRWILIHTKPFFWLWLQHYRALLLEGRERERAAEQHGVRAGQLGFFAQRSWFFYIFGFHQWIKLLPKAWKSYWFDSDAENIIEQIQWNCEFPCGCDLLKFKLTSKILMKSAKVNFNSHRAILLTLAATLQGPTAERERERERERAAEGRATGVLCTKKLFFLHFWLAPMNKIAAQSWKKALPKIVSWKSYWFDSDAENIIEQIHWNCEFPCGCDLLKIQINFQDPDEIRYGDL